MKLRMVLIIVLIISILSYTVIATKSGSQDPLGQNNKVGTSGTNNVPNTVSGHIFSGNYLKFQIRH